MLFVLLCLALFLFVSRLQCVVDVVYSAVSGAVSFFVMKRPQCVVDVVRSAVSGAVSLCVE